MISPRAAAYTDIDEPLPEMQQHFTYFDYCQKEELSKEGIIDTLKESVVRTSKQTFSANQAAPNKDQIISSFSNKVRSKLSGGTQWKNGVMVEGGTHTKHHKGLALFDDMGIHTLKMENDILQENVEKMTSHVIGISNELGSPRSI